jgi:hypothetical protein
LPAVSARGDQPETSSAVPSEATFTVALTVSPQHIRVYLALLIALLAIAAIFTQFVIRFGMGHESAFGIVPLFQLNAETNIATWLSSVMLLLTAALLAIDAAARRQRRDRYARHAKWLALMLLLMSLDETAAIHERTNYLLYPLNLTGFLYYPWVIFGTIVVIALVAAFRRYLWSFPPPIRRKLLLATVIFFGGAIGLEALSGWIAFNFPTSRRLSMAVATLENILEMAGVWLFISALLRHIATLTDVRVGVFAPSGETDVRRGRSG